MSEKKSLEEQTSKLTLANTSWLEPMKQWIQEASGLCKVAQGQDLFAKKTKLRKIFGSNLILSNKKARLCAPKIPKSPPGKPLGGAPRQPSKFNRKSKKFVCWCREQDSNLRRLMPTDLQSVVFDRFTIPARCYFTESQQLYIISCFVNTFHTCYTLLMSSQRIRLIIGVIFVSILIIGANLYFYQKDTCTAYYDRTGNKLLYKDCK